MSNNLPKDIEDERLKDLEEHRQHLNRLHHLIDTIPLQTDADYDSFCRFRTSLSHDSYLYSLLHSITMSRFLEEPNIHPKFMHDIYNSSLTKRFLIDDVIANNTNTIFIDNCISLIKFSVFRFESVWQYICMLPLSDDNFNFFLSKSFCIPSLLKNTSLTNHQQMLLLTHKVLDV